jgi:hypothetical protein
MLHLNSSLYIFELLETKLHYEPCLKNVSNNVKTRYKSNLTMKIDHFYWWSVCELMPESKIQNQIKKFDMHFSPLFKEKKLPPYNNCSNYVYVKFYCASNNKTTVFYFCKSTELYLIKG